MNKDIFELKIMRIIALLEEAGYEPYTQLQSYVSLGNDSYITRHGNARDRIKELEIQDIKEYLDGKMIWIV